MSMTYQEVLTALRREGVGVDSDTPSSLPTDLDAQWALLAPYVGRPLKDIPKGLVMLFVTDREEGENIMNTIRALPLRERQVVAATEELFI